MLSDDSESERFSRNAQKRAYTEFLVFAQVQQWLRRFGEVRFASRKKSADDEGK